MIALSISIIAAIVIVVGLVATIWLSVKDLVKREYAGFIFDAVLIASMVGALVLMACIIVSNLI